MRRPNYNIPELHEDGPEQSVRASRPSDVVMLSLEGANDKRHLWIAVGPLLTL